jgi:hypothetical protein
MLHAILHGKLNEAAPEPQRLEDALTSSVFGALIWAEAWDMLATWLGIADFLEPEGGRRECWFWPRMAFAEPDVVLTFGDVLVIVEAKFRSDRHDLPLAGEGEGTAESAGDQLLRQLRCITDAPESRTRYSDPIEAAISRRRHLAQAFVVDGRRRRARLDFEESRKCLPPDANLHLVTWQSLFQLLAQPPSARWKKDLRAFLEHLSLDTFEGVGRGPFDTGARRLSEWRAAQDREVFDYVPARPSEELARLSQWRATKDLGQQLGGWRFNPLLVEGTASGVIRAWRPSQEDQ